MDSRKVSEAQITHYLNQRDARRQSEIPLSSTVTLVRRSGKEERPSKSDRNLDKGQQGAIMTTCIVGWAHTPFGKLANESDRSDVEQKTSIAGRG